MRSMRRRATRILSGIKETVDEMNYAQRRLLEIPLEEFELGLRRQTEIQQLEALYRLESPA